MGLLITLGIAFIIAICMEEDGFLVLCGLALFVFLVVYLSTVMPPWLFGTTCIVGLSSFFVWVYLSDKKQKRAQDALDEQKRINQEKEDAIQLKRFRAAQEQRAKEQEQREKEWAARKEREQTDEQKQFEEKERQEGRAFVAQLLAGKEKAIDENKAGYVYILHFMDGVYKIGHTRRNPKLRANEWNYKLLAYAKTEDSAASERAIHAYLSPYRPGKHELFKVDFTVALKALTQVVGPAEIVNTPIRNSAA